MIAIPGLNILFWVVLWLAVIAVIKTRFPDSALGKVAAVLV